MQSIRMNSENSRQKATALLATTMSDFSSTLRCLLSESRKLKSLVIDQAEFGRDADWFELIKLTCEQIGSL
jgi:hypothetical protein